MTGAILVVDDSKAIRQLLGFVLRRAGHAVAEAGDGREALDRLGAGPVRLVVCDLYMPRLDGLAFLRTLRETPGHAGTPAIMLTTESREPDRRAGRALGVRAWITKPFDPGQIVAAVSRVLAPGAGAAAGRGDGRRAGG